MSEKGKNRRKNTGLGLAIWMLAMLIILIVGLVNWEKIKSNVRESKAGELIDKKIGKDIFAKNDSPKSEETETVIIDLKKTGKKQVEKPSEKTEVKSESNSEKKSESKKPESKDESKKTSEKAKTSVKEETASKTEKKSDSKKAETKKPDTKKSESASEKKTQTEVASKKQTEKSVAKKEAETIKSKICFVAIDSEGPVVRKLVSRSVRKDSPLGDALSLLFSGPSAAEAKTGCKSLIPAGSRLLSASVKNGVAILNFSEEFQYNQFGAEGSIAQLMQVVFTATEFNTVESVQFMIEGEKRDYLTEGVWIGSPLNRNSF